MTEPSALHAVLFDLDGTLLDTAPDLVLALNRLREEEHLPPLTLAQVRPVVSLGGRAMLEVAFGVDATRSNYEPLRERFLNHYRRGIAEHTRLFPGMDRVLDRLEATHRPWGIVTNKPGWLTEPLLGALALDVRAACVVSGDTTANRKPHPDPVLLACRRAGSRPAQCLFVGDARNDIEAGRQAGARTGVALFGYIPHGEDPLGWGADAAFEDARGLLDWIERAGAG